MGGRKQRKYRNQKVSVWELKFCEFLVWLDIGLAT